MPKVKISEYSATANSNTDVASINIDEGCAPSGINNAIRAVMGHLKDFQQGTYGDPFNGPVNGTLGATTASTAVVTTLNSTDATDASSTTAAAMKTAGGLAVAKKAYIGLDANIYGLTVGRGGAGGAANTAYGASAIPIAPNSGVTAIGSNAGKLFNTASDTGQSTFVGYFAGAQVSTGTDSTFVGGSAGTSTTTGAKNTAVGSQALQFTTTASYNTAVGYQAGYTNVTGIANTFIGYQAGYTSNTIAANGYNTATGYQAGKALTTGNNNSFFGFGSGQLITSGGKNTIVGAYDGNTGGLDIRTASNYIVLSDGDGNPRGYWTNTGVMIQSVSTTDNFAAQIKNSTATRPYGLYINFSGATPNNTTEQFLACTDSTNEKCVIYSSGTVTNRTGTYNAFSDIKLKQDVVDAGSQWDDIKAVRVRKFRLKDDVAADPNSKPLIGVIAQELEETSAGLIDDCVDKEGDITKSVKYSILYMKAVKALQEAMIRIEQLESKVNALEHQHE